MYLNKKTYIGNFYRKPEQQVKVTVPRNQKDAVFPIKKIKNERIEEITEQIGYWRKANSIHKWFVENVQEGEDNCGTYPVSKEVLKELLFLVNRVLEEPQTASDLLPTRSGFFFGSTDYDEYYFNDLKETKKILEEALKEENGGFYYSSSW